MKQIGVILFFFLIASPSFSQQLKNSAGLVIASEQQATDGYAMAATNHNRSSANVTKL